MPFVRTKWVKGKPYRYLVESHRVDGKVRQRVIEYLGAGEANQPEAQRADYTATKPIGREKAKQARLVRLFGLGGGSYGQGGHINTQNYVPLILNTLLDDGPQTAESLVAVVDREVTNNTVRNWAQAVDMYPETGVRGFAQDMIEQLVDQKLIEQAGETYNLTDRMLSSLGKPVKLIPQRRSIKGHSAATKKASKKYRVPFQFTVWPKEERERRDRQTTEEAIRIMDNHERNRLEQGQIS